MNFCRFPQWIIEIWNWLAEAKNAIACILISLLAVILGFITWHSADSIRISGYVLQFIGMVFAILGLLKIREHFEQDPLIDCIAEWLKRFPKWKKDGIVCHIPSAFHTISDMGVRVEVWASDDPDLPIENRVERIVRNLEVIREEQEKHHNLISKLNESHEAHKEKVVEQTQKLKNEIWSDRKFFHTNGLITSFIGLIWLTVGITMSTLAPELHKWIYG